MRIGAGTLPPDNDPVMPTRVYLMIAALVVIATGVITVRSAGSLEALEPNEVCVA